MGELRGYYQVAAVRAAEAELFTRVAPDVPMRRAAFGLAGIVAEELRARTGGVVGRAVALLVGSGDNGGDALWAGYFLRKRGVRVTAVLLDPRRFHQAGLAALRRVGGRVSERVESVDVVIDGIVGISGRGPLRPRAADIVAGITQPIVAADLPSGVEANTGAVAGPAVRAAVTVAFGAYKPVHALASEWCGRIALVPIGLQLPHPLDGPGFAQWEPEAIGRWWPIPTARDTKYTQGVVGISAGSAGYPGAAVLCVGGAVAATSGMVRYAGQVAGDVVHAHPEVVVSGDIATAGRVQAWVVGPGGGTDRAARGRLADLLATDLPVVVDADALTLLAAEPELVRQRRAPTILTPHAGEFTRLTGLDGGSDRIAQVRDLAQSWQLTVLLKGRSTIIAAPDGRTLVNDAGNSWAATAGSGDVLSGLIGALLAHTPEQPLWSAAAAARAHSLAAGRAATACGRSGAPISAVSLTRHLPAAIAELRHRGREQSPKTQPCSH